MMRSPACWNVACGFNLLQQCGAAVEPFGDRFERRSIVQRVERRLVRQLRRDVRRERASEICGGERVLDKRRDIAARGCQLLPRRIIHLAGWRQLMRLLKRRECALNVLPGPPVNLAR